MATVTGLTAERMLEIEAASIVDGEVVAGDLILTRQDTTQINAGSVIGPAGPTGPPVTAINDIGDVDTAGVDIGDVLTWNGTAWVPGLNIKVQNTAPTSPETNDLWVDTA